MADQCPTCGHEIEADTQVRFDLAANVVVGHGWVARLTGKEMAVLATIKEAYPHIVNKPTILKALYPLECDEAEIKIVDVFVCKIRKKLPGTGVRIETAWGEGYRLAYDEQESAA